MVYTKRILSTALAVAMILISVPAGSATETVSESYLAPGGLSANGTSVGQVINPPSGYLPTSPPAGLVPSGGLGGVHLHTSTFYNSVVLATSDDVFGTEGATAACFWAFGGDEICDPNDDVPSGAACGTHLLSATGQWRGAEATVWTFAILVTPSLEVCGASQGLITGDFFNS